MLIDWSLETCFSRAQINWRKEEILELTAISIMKSRHNVKRKNLLENMFEIFLWNYFAFRNLCVAVALINFQEEASSHHREQRRLSTKSLRWWLGESKNKRFFNSHNIKTTSWCWWFAARCFIDHSAVRILLIAHRASPGMSREWTWRRKRNVCTCV